MNTSKSTPRASRPERQAQRGPLLLAGLLAVPLVGLAVFAQDKPADDSKLVTQEADQASTTRQGSLGDRGQIQAAHSEFRRAVESAFQMAARDSGTDSMREHMQGREDERVGSDAGANRSNRGDLSARPVSNDYDTSKLLISSLDSKRVLAGAPARDGGMRGQDSRVGSTPSGAGSTSQSDSDRQDESGAGRSSADADQRGGDRPAWGASRKDAHVLGGILITGPGADGGQAGQSGAKDTGEDQPGTTGRRAGADGSASSAGQDSTRDQGSRSAAAEQHEQHAGSFYTVRKSDQGDRIELVSASGQVALRIDAPSERSSAIGASADRSGATARLAGSPTGSDSKADDWCHVYTRIVAAWSAEESGDSAEDDGSGRQGAGGRSDQERDSDR